MSSILFLRTFLGQGKMKAKRMTITVPNEPLTLTPILVAEPGVRLLEVA